MAIFKWAENSTRAWIISLAISSGIVLLALPYMKDIAGIFRLLCVVYTNE